MSSSSAMPFPAAEDRFGLRDPGIRRDAFLIELENSLEGTTMRHHATLSRREQPAQRLAQASVTVTARPMPRAAPVITATRPVRSPGARRGTPSAISMSSLAHGRLSRPRYPVSRRQSSLCDLQLLP
jgi:hypothetical protein